MIANLNGIAIFHCYSDIPVIWSRIVGDMPSNTVPGKESNSSVYWLTFLSLHHDNNGEYICHGKHDSFLFQNKFSLLVKGCGGRMNIINSVITLRYQIIKIVNKLPGGEVRGISIVCRASFIYYYSLEISTIFRLVVISQLCTKVNSVVNRNSIRTFFAFFLIHYSQLW